MIYCDAGEGCLAMAATFTVTLGAACVGMVGIVSELAVKTIDPSKHPILRKIGLIVAKTLQTAAAAVTLAIIGSLFTHPIGLIIGISIGSVLVLSPIVNAIVQQTPYANIKKITNTADKMASATSKAIHTAILTTAVFMALNIPAAIIAGVSLTALNVAVFKKD